jgi:SAM-dependent methyltransferase
MDPYAQMKQGVRWMWSLGDYGELAPILEPAAEAIVEPCDPDSSTRMLDVAAGTGNVVVIAAERGAHVTASDLTPRMIELGRSRSGREGSGSGSNPWLTGPAADLAIVADTVTDKMVPPLSASTSHRLGMRLGLSPTRGGPVRVHSRRRDDRLSRCVPSPSWGER